MELEKKDFLINYSAYDKQEQLIKSGQYIVYRSLNSLQASAKLEKYLEGELDNFGSLIIEGKPREIGKNEHLKKLFNKH